MPSIGLALKVITVSIHPHMTVRQVQVMAELARNPGASVYEVAGALRIPSPAVVRAVDKLVALRVAERQGSRTDRRLVVMRLTAKGQRVMREVDPSLFQS